VHLGPSLAEFIWKRQLWNDEGALLKLLLSNEAFFPVLKHYIIAHSVSTGVQGVLWLRHITNSDSSGILW
jgi:hypothetical protein